MKKRSTGKFLALSFLTFASFCATSCYSWWDQKIDIDTETGHISLGDFLYKEPTVSSLESPSQVLASQGLYAGTVKLHWTEVEHAASYRIERATVSRDSTELPEDDAFEVIEKFVYSTNYSDVILKSPSSTSEEYGNKYFYRISAENLSKGYESSEYTSITDEETGAVGWLLPSPQNVEAWKGKSTDEVRVSWNSVEGASSYIIYRGERADGLQMIELKTLPGTQTSYSNSILTSEQGKEFYYKVQAVLSNGSKSAESSLVLGYALTEGAPAAPGNVQVVNGWGSSTSEVTLKWDSVSGGVNDSISYSVYKNSSVDSNYVLVSNVTTNSAKDQNLKPGIYYYYYVQTIAKNNITNEVQKSTFSETTPITQAMGFLISPPGNVEAADGSDENHIVIRWTPAIGEDLQSEGFFYNIYSDTEKNGSYSSLTEGNISSIALTAAEDGFYEFEVEKHPFYKIVTVNSEGTMSSFSSGIAPSPLAPVSVTASKTMGGALTKNYSCNTNEVYPVKVTWKAPSQDNPAGYNVYRSTKKDSSFRKLNDTPLYVSDIGSDPHFALENGTFTYIDENSTAQPGTYYYYKVVSLNDFGGGKKSNDPTTDSQNLCRGYGAITREQWFREYNKSIMKSQSKLTLMHKANDMDKLGSETINGDFGGTLSYKAAIAGLGAEITMHYENYCDFYIMNDESLGKYFVLTGNTDTTSNMSANGNMHEKVNCTGMYPGYAIYDHLEIKGGAAGGGYYTVETYDLSGAAVLSADKVDWKVGEEH